MPSLGLPQSIAPEKAETLCLLDMCLAIDSAVLIYFISTILNLPSGIKLISDRRDTKTTGLDCAKIKSLPTVPNFDTV
jgi:hypothetical protein